MAFLLQLIEFSQNDGIALTKSSLSCVAKIFGAFVWLCHSQFQHSVLKLFKCKEPISEITLN